ncbi:MAG: cyclase family protein [Candidatus Binatia bacterium]
MTRPPYRDPPVVPGAPAQSAWGLYGSDDEIGALNSLTDEDVAAAATLVRTGKRFRLDLPLDEPAPPFFTREPFRHEVFHILDTVLDDRLDGFFPQGSTQWDALAHCGHPAHGFYNGRSAEDVRAGALGIDGIARRGIAARGVLADVAAFRAARGTPIDPRSSYAITAGELHETLAAQRITLRRGDVLCVRTGWLGWYLGCSRPERVEMAARSREHSLALPGLGGGPEMAGFVWDGGVMMLAADTPMVDAYPITGEFEDTMHIAVMALLGIPLGEFFVLDELAAACARDRTYEFFFTSAPLRLRGGIGSPPNALAIK